MPPASLTRVCEFSTQFGATTVTVMFCTNPFPRQKIKIRHGTDGKSADGATPGFQYLRSTGSCGCTRRTNLVASKAADRNVRDSIFADREQSCCNKEVYCTRAACSLSIWLVFRFGKTLSIKESVPRYLRSTTLDQCGSMMADCNERQPESSSKTMPRVPPAVLGTWKT